MRIAVVVRKLMMDTVRGHPENRPAFERQRRAPGKKVFHPLRSLLPAMRQQAMIGHTDAEAAGNPPQENSDKKCRPGKEKQCRNRAHVKQSHGDRRAPIEAVATRPLAT